MQVQAVEMNAVPKRKATVHTASKGKQKEVHNRSLVKVEQLLPPVEPVHDPRNFYASDSPVIEDPDSDDELYKSAEEDMENIELDSQGDGLANESNSGSNLFQHRHEITKLYNPLKKHLGILDALGVDGMSLDESSSDPHTGQTMYTVVKPGWQHPDLHHWLKVFDELHHQNQANGCILDKWGMFTHIRAGSQKIQQTSHAPPDLPLKPYDPRWLKSRENLYVKHELRPIKDQYIFNHPSDVIAFVFLYHFQGAFLILITYTDS
ncbi:hypothetical protein EDB89DRAFT_2061994 [Lactarius sanguifluus]|nr:hypothetical protein EDB89DRAFT_2061994 [Lactarius sanguifluus]